MKTYVVEILETLLKEVRIPAANWVDAEEIARQRHSAGIYALTSAGDGIGAEYKVVSIDDGQGEH